MAPRSEQLLRHLRRLVSEREPEPDTVLLSRFVKERDEAAFAELVRRHGAMVLGVCRRVLHDEHQAEDALQATFLLLAKKAATVRPTASLAAWLHTVARHLALKCRRTEERHRLRETVRAQSPAVAPPRDPLDELTARELLHILDEEIQRLSEAYRLPLILCALEGLSVEEASCRLAWAPGSVRGRLARGRAKLHARLARRGVLLPAGAIAALLAPRVEASLSALAVKTLVEGADMPDRVAALVESGLDSLKGTKLKIGLTLLLTAVAAAGAGGLAYQAPPTEQPAANRTAEKAKSQVIPKERTDRYGDPLPPGAVARLGTVRFRMDGLVYACTYSPDGKTLAASADDIVYLFDGAAGKPLRRLRGNGPGDLLSLAYSPDGKTLAASSADNTILSWEPNTGKLLRSFGTPLKGFPVRSLAFTPDGRGLVSGGEASVIYLWDPATGMELRRFTEFKIEVHRLALSKDGQTMASADLHEIRLWETASGKRVRLLKGTEGRIRALAFSPDGKLLASGNDDHTVWLWETAKGKVRHKLPGKRQKGVPGEFGDVCALAFSPDGKTLATGSTNHTLRLWDVAEGKLLREVPGIRSVSRDGYHEGGIPCVAFSPDGRKLAFGQDKRLALLDVQSGVEVPRLAAHGGAVRRVFFSRDGQRLITISDDAVRRILEWDSSSGRLIREVPGKPWWARQATLSPDRKVLAATGFGFGLDLSDTESGKKLRGIPVPNAPSGGIPHAVAFSPDGKLLAMSGDNGEAVWLINAATGKTVCIVEGPGRRPLQAVLLTFSPDGRLLASAGRETIHLAAVPSGRQRWKITLPNDHSVTAFAFSLDGKSLAAARFDTSLDAPISSITVWEITSGEERLRFRVPPGRLSALVYSPDGRWLAPGGEDRSVYLWDSATGKQACRLEGHRGNVEALEFAPDGRRLASASADTTVLIWDVPHSSKSKVPTTALKRKELEALWSALASNDASKAYQAMHKLESVPEQAVPLLADRLRPKAAPDTQHVTRLLSQLDSETFAERERATEELRELGWAVESSLREALESKLSLEMRKRINDLLAGIRGPRLPTDLLRMLRGVEVLEHINSEASRQLLRKLADPSLPEGLGRDELRREAEAALQRFAPVKR